MADQLFNVSSLSNVADPQTQVPAFAFMFTNPAAPDDTYSQIVFTGVGFGNVAKIAAGFSDMHDACFDAASTAWYGFFGTRQDGGSSNAESGYIVGDAGYFSGGSGVGYYTYAPVCEDDEGAGPFAEGNSGPFSQDPDGSAVIIISGNRCLAKVVTFDLNSSPGTQSITGLGWGTEVPDAVIFLGCVDAADGVSTDGTNWMMGAADKNGNQWVGCTRSDFFSNSPIQRYSRWDDDACIAHIGATQVFGGVTTQDQLASFVSADPDGFTIDLTAAGLDSNGNPMTVRALAIKVIGGGSFGIEVGNGVQGDTAIATSFDPKVMTFCSTQQVTPGVVSTIDCYAALGAVDAFALERAYWAGSETKVTSPPADNWSYTSTSSSIRWADYQQSLLAEATVALGTAGAALTWTTDDASGRLFGWIAFRTVDQFPHNPEVVTLPAAGVTPTQATLRGTVRPNAELDATVTWFFEYGPTTAYGTSTPGGSIPGDFSDHVVSDVIVVALPIGYHFRVVAVDEFGCIYPGEDHEVVQSSSWRQIRIH